MKSLKIILAVLFIGPSLANAGSLDYYREVNNAELAVCKKDLKTAYYFYKKAMSINPGKAFSKDLLNAFYCSLDIDSFTMAKDCIAKLLMRGVNSDIVYRLFWKYEGRKKDSINHWIHSISNDTAHSNDAEIAIRKMIKSDQDVRRFFSERTNGAYMVDSVYRVDAMNAKELLDIFKRKGVMSESLVGNDGNDIISGPLYDMIVVHHVGAYIGGLPSHLFDTLLFKAIFSYDYHPERFAQLLNRSEFASNGTAFSYRTYSIHLPITIDCIYVYENGAVYPQYLEPAKEKQINYERNLIGLESLDELRYKVVFQKAQDKINSKYCKYIFGTGVGLYEDAEWLKKAQPYIDKFQKYKPE